MRSCDFVIVNCNGTSGAGRSRASGRVLLPYIYTMRPFSIADQAWLLGITVSFLFIMGIGGVLCALSENMFGFLF